MATWESNKEDKGETIYRLGSPFDSEILTKASCGFFSSGSIVKNENGTQLTAILRTLREALKSLIE